MNSPQTSRKIHDAITAISTGIELGISGEDSLAIDITGTATSFTANFEGSINDKTTWEPIGMVNKADFTTGITTSTKNRIYETDVSLLTHFRVNVTAISGGNITVYARSISSR